MRKMLLAGRVQRAANWRPQAFTDAPYIRRTTQSTGSPNRMSAVPSSEPFRLLV
jgi:hypothetical protein